MLNLRAALRANFESYFPFMATTNFYLDARAVKSDKPLTLKLAIVHNRTNSLLSLNIKLSSNQWDNKRQLVKNHAEAKMLNLLLSNIKQRADAYIFELDCQDRLSALTATQLKDIIECKLSPDKAALKEQANLFAARFKRFAETKKLSTQNLYMVTYRRLEAFCGKSFTSLRFEDISKTFLSNFDKFLSKTSPSQNARNIHLRNIRAVFNDAIDDEVTAFYPFRRYKIKPVSTAKRNLKVEDLRLLFDFPCEQHAKHYLDMFKLMFMLIGINAADLAQLKTIVNGRIEYNRAKTNRLYSIKVEPEALEIIERHKGSKWLVDISDRYFNHIDYLRRMNKALKKIGEVKRSGLGGKKSYKPLFPDISSYWARHSWATIAASLDIPRDTIAHALGHGNNTITDIYIDYDLDKVDAANRKVLDWVLYGKK